MPEVGGWRRESGLALCLQGFGGSGAVCGWVRGAAGGGLFHGGPGLARSLLKVISSEGVRSAGAESSFKETGSAGRLTVEAIVSGSTPTTKPVTERSPTVKRPAQNARAASEKVRWVMADYDSVPPVYYDDPLVFYDAPPVPPTVTRKNSMKVKLGLNGQPVADQVAKVNSFVTGMTGNPNFTTPIPPLASVTLVTNGVTAAITASILADDAAVARRTEKEVAIGNMLECATCLGGYVQSKSGGSAVVIQSANMGVVAPPSPIGELSAVESLKITFGINQGEFKLKWSSVYGADSYVIETSPDPTDDSKWSYRGTVTGTKYLLTGLPVNARCSVRVRAIGAAGPGGWSPTVTKGVPQL